MLLLNNQPSHLFSNFWLIAGFAVVIVVLLALDLGVFSKKKTEKVSNKTALRWVALWVTLSFIFAGIIYIDMGSKSAAEFLTAYLIEQSLSVDNLFIFILVFKFFKVPEEYHHRVLFWGIIGAIAMRAVFIFSGLWLINLSYINVELFGKVLEVNFILVAFGFFLVYAGIKSFKPEDEDKPKDFSKNFGVRITKAFFPVVENYEGDKFFVVKNGKRYGTLLLIVVAVIEASDLLFAVDSIPAIFTITNDPLILYTSNIFAIMGLRSMYFVLASFINLFHYLKYGLAIILTFIGLKMVVNPVFHISSIVSLSVVALTLIISVLISLALKKNENTNLES